MTSKEKVKEIYPDSRAEKYKTRDILTNTYYYLIWDTYKLSERRRLGEGTTEAKAWKDALYWVENKNE